MLILFNVQLVLNGRTEAAALFWADIRLPVCVNEQLLCSLTFLVLM